MASKAAHKRLTKEALLLKTSPPPFITARPLESNIRPPGTPYEGGEYHGKLIFPPEYPFKPPAIKMMTPNGRFQVNTRLCLSMSDFHPGSWNPAWSVATILTGLLSFMLEDTSTTGSIETSVHQKKVFAKESLAFNRNSPKFRELFPDLIETLVSIDKKASESERSLAESDKKETSGGTPATPAVPRTTQRSSSPILTWSMIFVSVVLYLVATKMASRLSAS